MTALELVGLVSALLFTAMFALLVLVVMAELTREFARGIKPRRVAPTEPRLHLVGAEVVIDARARFAERRQIGGAA